MSADDEDDLDPLVVKEQVRRAIERRRNGNPESYETLRAVFMRPPEDKRELARSTRFVRVHVQALLANVAILSKDCSSLIHTVLDSEWIGRDDVFCELFVKFITNLAAAQRGYQNKIMGMLVEQLGPQESRYVPDCKTVKEPKIHQRALQAIQYIAANVPSAPASLADRLSANMEFEFEDSKQRMTFIRNYMQLINYVPELTDEILVCVLRQLIKLDVNIQENFDNLDDDEEEELLQHMSDSQTLVASSQPGFGLHSGMPSPPTEDEDDDISSIASDDSDAGVQIALSEESEEATRIRLRDNIKQVDAIMDMLFSYYTTLLTSSFADIRTKAIQQLFTHFHYHILPTHRSRHPQFLIFHFAQFDPTTTEQFITSCIEILLDKSLSAHRRHAAAAYFSGFVGRGAHVNSLLVSDCLDILVDELKALREKYTPGCRGPDLKRYGDFYAVFQAILYIFCFRWREIAVESTGSGDEDSDDDDDLTFPSLNHSQNTSVPKLRFDHSLKEEIHLAIHSKLNPLRVCTPEIVQTFADLTAKLQLMYLYTKIDENKNVRATTAFKSLTGPDFGVSDTTRDMSWVGDNGVMEQYFPYDPYILSVSRRWIEGDYVAWRGLPGQKMEESDAEEEEDEDDDELQEIL